jgi:hypothetical protein
VAAAGSRSPRPCGELIESDLPAVTVVSFADDSGATNGNRRDQRRAPGASRRLAGHGPRGRLRRMPCTRARRRGVRPYVVVGGGLIPRFGAPLKARAPAFRVTIIRSKSHHARRLCPPRASCS